MMMVMHRLLKKKDNIINILMINDSDILNLHQDHIHRTNLVKQLFKVLNVKAVVLGEIVNAPERVPWELLVCSVLFFSEADERSNDF